jgi:hypothetical protein
MYVVEAGCECLGCMLGMSREHIGHVMRVGSACDGGNPGMWWSMLGVVEAGWEWGGGGVGWE